MNISGVGSSTPGNALVTQPGMAFLVDGVYLANSISLDQTLFDIDRVEVLRGPQGSLYGQSSTGGVINLVIDAALDPREMQALVLVAAGACAGARPGRGRDRHRRPHHRRSRPMGGLPLAARASPGAGVRLPAR